VSSDVLSDVLRAVRLTGAVYFSLDASAPFAAEALPANEVAPYVMPGLEHVLEYHLVTRGSCWGGIVGEDPLQLQEGDIVVFPQGDPHVISSSPGLRGPTAADLYRRRAGTQLPFTVREGTPGGARTEVVCGFLGYDRRPFNPLLATLPRILRVSTREGGGWLESLARLAVAETTGRQTGGESVLAKASELMFVEVIRRYLAALPPEQTGWLAGLRDPFVGRALAAPAPPPLPFQPLSGTRAPLPTWTPSRECGLFFLGSRACPVRLGDPDPVRELPEAGALITHRQSGCESWLRYAGPSGGGP
jgi:hypothetical protein